MKSFLVYSILLTYLVGSTLALDQKDCRCRVQSSRRIIDGGEGRSRPWHLSLGWAVSKENRISVPEADKIKRHLCGAVILNEEWVITAGDCVYDLQKGKPLKPEAINLGYNSADLVEMFDQNKFVEVDQIVFHPGYDPKNYDANLALLKLKTPFKFDGNVQPACLELDHPRKLYKELLVGFGFGVTSLTYVDSKTSYFYGNNSRYLKESSLKDNSGKLEICLGQDLDEVVCVEGLGSLCKGDEGGPLQKQANGKETVIGIASYFGRRSVYKPPGFRWAVKPCVGPAAYSHLSAPRFINWIEKMTGGEYCH